MIGIIKNITGRIKSSPVISGNSAGVNAFLFLFFASYFIVGVDLSKDLAKGGDEFNLFCEVLEDTNTVDVLSYLDHLKTDPPLIGETSVFMQFIEDNDLASIPHTRGPPQQS